MISLTAFAVLCTFVLGIQEPHLTIAQSIIESGANPRAIGKVGEKGAFQVREKYWGKVPRTYKAQAKQAERIRNILTEQENGDIIQALERYNGIGKPAEQYVRKVLHKTFELALWEV